MYNSNKTIQSMYKTKRMKTLAENHEVNVRNTSVKLKESAMSTKTKDFIQKICYKKTASIDMTQHGFIHDSKLDPVNTYMMKPLRAQMEKITVKPSPKHEKGRRHNSSLRKACKVASPALLDAAFAPKSALSCPGARSSHAERKVRIQSDSNSSQVQSITKKKSRVTLNQYQEKMRRPL